MFGNKNTKLSISSTAGEILDRVNKAISKDSKDPEAESEEEVLELTEEVNQEVPAPQMEENTTIPTQVTAAYSVEEEIKNETNTEVAPKRRTATSHNQKKKTKTTQKGSVKKMAKKLVSSDTAEATSALFNKLKESAKSKKESNSLRFESGNTVENLIAELIKPQLSEWLDEHLANIVKEVVEKEVKKLLPSDD